MQISISISALLKACTSAMAKTTKINNLLSIIVLIVVSTACGGGGGGGSDSPATDNSTDTNTDTGTDNGTDNGTDSETNTGPFTLAGTVAGLNGTLVINQAFSDDANSADIAAALLVQKTIIANGSFTFAKEYNSGDSYSLYVVSSPASQHCEIVNGTGTISANVTTIEISCSEVDLLTQLPIEEMDEALVNCIKETAFAKPFATIADFKSLSCSMKGITSTTGIEDLTALQTLDLSLNNIEQIDVSTLTELTDLNLGNDPTASAQLKSDLIANLKKLPGIDAALLQLSASTFSIVTISKLADFMIDGFNDVLLTTGSLPEFVNPFVNHLVTLDVSNLTKLRKLNVFSNTLTTLDLSSLNLLEEVDASANDIAIFSVDNIDQLTELNLMNNLLTDINISQLSSDELALDVRGNDFPTDKVLELLNSSDQFKELLISDLKIAGTITGLPSGESITLGGPRSQTVVNADGSYALDEYLYSGQPYIISISADPTSANCSFTSELNAGTITANIENLDITCQ